MIVVGSSFNKCKHNLDLVVSTLKKCGFILNMAKSQLVPAQSAVVLGFLINSRDEIIALGHDKRSAILRVLTSALSLKSVKIREFARWIGLCISILPCFPRGRMFYRQLERSKLWALQISCFKWNKTMHMSDRDHVTLSWWVNVVNNDKPHMFQAPPISSVLETDSSSLGWGEVLKRFLRRQVFRFGHADLPHPINTKELLAVFYGIFLL